MKYLKLFENFDQTKIDLYKDAGNLEGLPFKGKEVDIIGTSKGGYDKYFASYRGILDPSNKIQNEIMYVKGEKVI